jgi:hypothetical protein
MMRRTLLVAAFGLLIHSAVLAQYAVRASASDIASAEIKAMRSENLLEQYKSKHRNNAHEGRKVLDEMYALGMVKNAENVKAIRALIASKVTNEEKVALARILGGLYSADDPTGMNATIAQDLRGLTHDGQKDVARAATLTFSRLTYFPDSPEVLLSAKKRGLIDMDEYYGELAHLTAYAPANEQANLVSTIRNGKNRYAAEILAFVSQEAAIMKKFYPETKKQILSLLEEHEPEFSKVAIGEFDYTDAVRYSTWLHATATLNRDVKNTKYHDLIMARLNDEKIDPRKIMAFLASSEGKRLIKDIGRREPFESMHQRIALYSKQLPQNMIMKELVDDISATLRLLKE